MKRGKPERLVASVYEKWPIEALPELPPDLRGLYVIYDSDDKPIRVGISGRGRKQRVIDRIWNEYYRDRYWRAAHTFTVFTFTQRSNYKQVESFVLFALGKALSGNVKGGAFRKATEFHGPPGRVRYPGYFVHGAVGPDGRIRVQKRWRNRRVRVEIGPPESD